MRYFIISVIRTRYFCWVTQTFYGVKQLQYPTQTELQQLANGGTITVAEVSEEDYLQFFELAQ